MKLSPGQIGIRQPSLNRKTVSLETDLGSIGPVKGIASLGCRLKPSSVLRTLMSLQSEAPGSAQSRPAVGRSTRSPVSWLGSGTVKRSAGNGAPCGSERSKRTCTAACARAAGTTTPNARQIAADKTKTTRCLMPFLLVIGYCRQDATRNHGGLDTHRLAS